MKLSLVIICIFLSCTSAERLLQISDFHFDADYSPHGDTDNACHENTTFTSEDIGFYGNYNCDSPKTLVKHALTHAQKIIPEPSFILWTGDNVPHIDNYTSQYVIDSINVTTSLIDKYYPRSQVLPLFGNHDYAPANNFPDHESSIYSLTFSLWKKWIGESQRETFLKGGYYIHRPEGSNVTFLMLNTNIYHDGNKASFDNIADPGQQFAFMEKVLEDAEKAGEKVHVVAHIGPGMFERTPHWYWMANRYNKKLVNIFVKYSKTIKWMLFGHHHTDTFHIVKDSEGIPIQLMLMAPAVTPWFSDLKGAGSNNPAFRIIDYDPNTWEYNDILTYYVNLTALNEDHSTPWELEYSMKKDYGLEVINATSMNALLESFKTNDSMFMKYIEYNSVFWEPKLPQGKFRSAQLCSIEHPDLDEYEACMYTSGSKLSINVNLVLSITLLGIIIFTQ